ASASASPRWLVFFFSSRRRHTRWPRDWSSDVCSSDLGASLSIGGSEATRHIMPRIGFERVWEQRIYARVLRPFRQFRTRPGSKTPREIARLLRNTAYWLAPKAIANTWSAREVEAIENRLLADSQSSAGPASIHQQAFI